MSIPLTMILISALLLAPAPGSTAVALAGAATTAAPPVLLQKPGERIPLGPKHYFVYGFTKPPKLGTAVVRVEIFTQNGTRDTSFVVKGDADMPSMRGVHAAGDKEFSLSAKGSYLLPVRLVMPGDWEVSLSFQKEGKQVLRGVYLFDL